MTPDMLPDLMFRLRCRIIYIDDTGANAGYDAGYAAGISAGCPRIWYRNQYTADFCTGGRSIISSAGLTTAYTYIRGFTGPRESKSFGTLYPFLEWNHSVQCSASMCKYLESCHSGEFITGSHAEVSKILEEERTKEGYVDPTQTLPDPPPSKCRQDHQGTETLQCKTCKDIMNWEEKYKITVDDLLHRSNVHSCSRGTNKDGTRKKNKSSGSCMDNKWNTCKARFPRLMFLKTAIDDWYCVYEEVGSMAEHFLSTCHVYS